MILSFGGNPIIKEEYDFVKSVGGLFVFGTERHEARRIDNQFRGRSGRQGDPGETQFYVSLEDDLMRVFGSERIKTMMGRFGIPEDTPIKNSFVNNALESAQKKIEGFHFDSRKHTLEYDDVMNHQRQSIYERRQKMLKADKKEIEKLLNNILENRDDKTVNLVKEKRAKVGEEGFLEVVRRIALYTTDALWMEHIEAMDYLRSSVNLRAYGQRDPIVEYKKEGLRMFKDMEEIFKEQCLSLVENINEPAKADSPTPKQTLITSHNEPSQFSDTKKLESNSSSVSVKKEEPKVGRNDACPCGSGKKYKKCCGV